MMSDILSLNESSSRTAHILREKEAKRIQERQQHILHLVAAFLEEQGYASTHQALWKEAQLSKDVQVCDNIDLETVLQEYIQYYFSKFNRYPKICRKCESSSAENVEDTKRRKKEGKPKNSNKSSTVANNNPQTQKGSFSVEDLSVGVTVTPIFTNDKQLPKITMIDDAPTFNHKSLKPIGGLYPIDSEWYEIAKVISMETVSGNLNVRWDDIVGLKDAKDILKSSIVYPMLYPEFYSGKFSPPKGILLHGPPGTGKTMLAKAVATECDCTFFNITSSSIISKWRGDSEKYVRVLFELAKYYAPAVIFIDEVDWISYTSDSEPAKRFRAEFLARLDGLLSSENSDVIILAATNVRNFIDKALLRRLGRQVIVDFPDPELRRTFLEPYFTQDLIASNAAEKIYQQTFGFSCADLKLLCKEAWRLQMEDYLDLVKTNRISIKNIPQGINNLLVLETALTLIKQ